MLTRLGEYGADGFTIMRIAGHNKVTASQRYVHPTPEGMELGYERLEKLSAVKYEQAEVETNGDTAGNPADVPTAKSTGHPNLRKSVN